MTEVTDGSSDEHYLRVRRTGWISNFAVMLLTATVIYCGFDRLKPLLLPVGPSLFYFVPLYICGKVTSKAITNVLKWLLYVKYFGMSQRDYTFAISPRSKWKGTEVAYYEKQYGTRAIKIMDATNRRCGHISENGFRLFFLVFVIPSTPLVLQHLIAIMIFAMSWRLYLEESDRLGNYAYSGVRIRDGRFGRFNLVVVTFWGTCGKVLAVSMMVLSGVTELEELQAFIALCLQPLLWGDTAGEVVGSFFGRLSFNVYGFGDVNQKTVEGTLAVFVASYASLYVCYSYFPFGITFVLPVWAALCLAALVGTFAEVASPRGTDNFFMVTMVTACLIALRA